MFKTEILNIEYDIKTIDTFHLLLRKWFDIFGLRGRGLLIGHKGKDAKNFIRNRHPSIDEIYTVDLEKADIIHDITKPFEIEDQYDWIICQAVLEHVIDPVASIKNLADILKRGGKLYVHMPGPTFPQHRYPLDCYRFFRDALVGWGKLFDLKILDISWQPYHSFVVYEK